MRKPWVKLVVTAVMLGVPMSLVLFLTDTTPMDALTAGVLFGYILGHEWRHEVLKKNEKLARYADTALAGFGGALVGAALRRSETRDEWPTPADGPDEEKDDDEEEGKVH